MSMIKVENLTFSYPSSYDPIFENVSFQIDTDWKLGFVGRNGRGKTTFLNLLMDQYEYRGKIIKSVRFDYFPYLVKDTKKWTMEVLNEVCPQAEEWQIRKELYALEVDEEVLWRPFETLSNGEQTKVLLAALFLNEGHFLLIDEPTNHLDTHGRQIVSEYLRKKKGFILVSHDRCFLDGCVDHILSLNRSNIEVQSGTFSAFLQNFEQQQRLEEAQNESLKKDIRRLSQSAKRTQGWSDRVEASKTGAADKGYIGHKSAKMMKRAKSIEARQQKAIEQKSGLLKNQGAGRGAKTASVAIPFGYTGYVFRMRQFAMGEIRSAVRCPFLVHRGERVVLDGSNGSGKSSLLKLVAGEALEHTGTITMGSGLVISYVPQDTSHLQGTLSDFAKKSQIEEALFKAILRKLDFERIQFEKEIQDFSGGQKKKVLIAKSLCEQAHLYVWDEPLNFVDLYSRMQIERLIREFSPTMLLVEHDQAFREAVATKTVQIEGAENEKRN